jgi:hypothetical protein
LDGNRGTATAPSEKNKPNKNQEPPSRVGEREGVGDATAVLSVKKNPPHPTPHLRARGGGDRDAAAVPIEIKNEEPPPHFGERRWWL